MIAHLRNDTTEELAPPRSVGTDAAGRPLYQGVAGWTPVDSDGQPVEVDFDVDGNFTVAPTRQAYMVAVRAAAAAEERYASSTCCDKEYRDEEPGCPVCEPLYQASLAADAELEAARAALAGPEERIYPDGARIEVWQEHRREWVPGTVYDHQQRDGVWRYRVRLSGHVAMDANDPASWFLASEMRPVMEFSTP